MCPLTYLPVKIGSGLAMVYPPKKFFSNAFKRSGAMKFNYDHLTASQPEVGASKWNNLQR